MVSPIIGLDASSAPYHGFVVAMRARLKARERPPYWEWIIVCRWGTSGQYLSIAWTSIAAAFGQDTPIDLRPRRTALATVPTARRQDTFSFLESLPHDINVAGQFVPVKGSGRLLGNGDSLGLRASGFDIGYEPRSTWQMHAIRAPWSGEYFDVAGRNA